MSSKIPLWRCSLNVFVIVFVFEGVLQIHLSLSFCLPGHVFLSLWANVFKVTSLKDHSLKVFSKCLCICHCLFVGQVMFSHQSDQMSQRSQMSTCRQGWIPPRLQWAPSKDLSISSSLIFNLKCLHTTEISSPSAAGVKYNICTFTSFSIRFPGRVLWRRFSCCVSHVYIIVLKTTNTNAKSSLLSRIRRAIN